MLKSLVKIANKLDSLGLTKEADCIDRFIIDKIASFSYTEQDIGKTIDRVAAAIKLSIGMPHFDNAFRMRNPSKESEGSTFLEPQTPESLMRAEWHPYNHPAISLPAVGFMSQIPGYFGVLELSNLNSDMPVEIVKSHKGAINEAVCLISSSDTERPKADHTTILLGPGDSGEIVWTFFPGPPIAPSSLAWDDSLQETIRTVREAISAGFKYGKLSG